MQLDKLLIFIRPRPKPLVLAVVLLASSVVQSDWLNDLPGARSIGAGQFRWYGFPIYEARLWSSAPHPTLDQSFALEIVFLCEVKRETLVNTSLDEIRRLSTKEPSPARFVRWEYELRRAFVDVKPSQRLTGVYLPGSGCRFYVDGELRYEVKDPTLARVFFSIWLDPRTRMPKLRRALLGFQQQR